MPVTRIARIVTNFNEPWVAYWPLSGSIRANS
jgi:hypothetical protein